VEEEKRLATLYRREAIELGQRSPFRQRIYIAARKNGKSKGASLKQSRDK
jgi:hypothetical protein